jgi:purine-nucleoside phosphorylase
MVLTSQKLAGNPVEIRETPVVSHEEVLQIGKQKADVLRLLVERVVGKI